MKASLRLVAVLLVAAACSSFAPVAVRAGDICFRCHRVIADPKLAAEAIYPSGHAFKFRTVSCMAQYLAQDSDKPQVLFVTDYPSGAFVKAGTANFVRTVIDDNTRESDYLAFRSFDQAMAHARQRGRDNPIGWDAVMTTVRMAHSN